MCWRHWIIDIYAITCQPQNHQFMSSPGSSSEYGIGHLSMSLLKHTSAKGILVIHTPSLSKFTKNTYTIHQLLCNMNSTFVNGLLYSSKENFHNVVRIFQSFLLKVKFTSHYIEKSEFLKRIIFSRNNKLWCIWNEIIRFSFFSDMNYGDTWNFCGISENKTISRRNLKLNKFLYLLHS